MRTVLRDALILGPILATLGIVGYLALRAPNDWWAAGFSTAVGAALLFAVLAAIFRAKATRAFWTGFAAFGATYAVMVGAPGLGDEIRPLLVTSDVLNRIYLVWNAAPVDSAASSTPLGPAPAATQASITFMAGSSAPFTGLSTLPPIAPRWGSPQLSAAPGGTDVVRFDRIGQSITTIVLALMGGIAGRFLYATGAPRSGVDPNTAVA
jgi:hypothetical protein